MNRILVIGGTGTVGRQVLSRLAATGPQVHALARNPGAHRLPEQVEVVLGDLTLPKTLDSCLDGIDAVFLADRPGGRCCSRFGADREARTAHRIAFSSSQNAAPPLSTAQSGQSNRRADRAVDRDLTTPVDFVIP